jgi:hypothetical protein
MLAAAEPCLWSQTEPTWGGPVLDTHLHLRRDADACFTHMHGCGVTHAVLLTPAKDEERAKQEMDKRPGRFARSVAADPSGPDAVRVFRDALSSGAVSIGEIKYHLALDSPEMRRLYDISAEFQVPVMNAHSEFSSLPG